ncbi:unannotated protein [freshwater metagenome]|jgi:uncharacterized protein (DUF305 family)|uniref:Unannotated protein n=1 Tax=freshwater metagenome TaxID=449393 RepID=A0A6J7HVH0_9ZZZZ|nr:DUF305 domain-containing protein [Actinomycetota bacterium]
MKHLTTRTGVLALALTGALAVAGCGSDDSNTSASGGHDMSSMSKSTTTAAASAADVDKAFVSQMIPHHEMAVEMAGYAPAQGERSQIRGLGKSIIAGQAPEITQMKAIATRLGVTPAAMPMDGESMDHGSMTTAASTLGLSMDDMGMSMKMGALKDAKPFDRAFIDEMIPHHQGAIRMARAELAKGSDPELKKVATAIVAAQKKEIAQMNSWREQWYGSPSPAGGVPAA